MCGSGGGDSIGSSCQILLARCVAMYHKDDGNDANEHNCKQHKANGRVEGEEVTVLVSVPQSILSINTDTDDAECDAYLM